MNSVIKVVFCALVGIFYYMCLMSFPYQNDKGEVTVYTKQPNACNSSILILRAIIFSLF